MDHMRIGADAKNILLALDGVPLHEAVFTLESVIKAVQGQAMQARVSATETLRSHWVGGDKVFD